MHAAIELDVFLYWFLSANATLLRILIILNFYSFTAKVTAASGSNYFGRVWVFEMFETLN